MGYHEICTGIEPRRIERNAVPFIPNTLALIRTMLKYAKVSCQISQEATARRLVFPAELCDLSTDVNRMSEVVNGG